MLPAMRHKGTSNYLSQPRRRDLLFGHAVDVIVALVLGREIDKIIVREPDRRLAGLNADMKCRKTGHHNLVSRHADNTPRMR